MNIACNKKLELSQGWFVVRNRSVDEMKTGVSSQQRHLKEEELFNRDPWDTLPRDRRGTEALKTFLANLLCKEIQDIFPQVLRELKGKKSKISSELESLGRPRALIVEKR